MTRFPTRDRRSLVHRQAYTPARPLQKSLPDLCRHAPRPLQTRPPEAQTPADTPSRPLQTRRCCQAGSAISSSTAARTPLPATTLRSALSVLQVYRKLIIGLDTRCIPLHNRLVYQIFSRPSVVTLACYMFYLDFSIDILNDK